MASIWDSPGTLECLTDALSIRPRRAEYTVWGDFLRFEVLGIFLHKDQFQAVYAQVYPTLFLL